MWAPPALLWPHPQIDAVLQLSLGLGRWCRSLLTLAWLSCRASPAGTGPWMSGEQGEPEGHQSSSCIPGVHPQQLQQLHTQRCSRTKSAEQDREG